MVTGLLKSPIGSFEQSVSAAEAAAKAINASGGVGGHPIAVVTCDDGGAAAKAAQCAQQAVDTKVAAIVGSVFLVPDYFPILEGAKIPFVGGAAPLPQESASPLAYPLTSGASGEFSAMGAWVASNIGKNVAIFAADNPTGAYTSGAIEATATAAGATVSVVKAPAGAPDFSPFASNILSSNPDVVVLALVPTDVVPAVQALRGQGYTGPIANIQSTLNQAVIDALGSAAEGVTTFSSWALPDATTSKLMDRFNKEMAEYAPDAARDGFSESAWSAVNAIAAALKGSTAVDAAAVVAGLDANKIDLVGMAGGAPFAVSATSGVSKDKPRIFNPYVVVYRVKAGKFEQIQDFYDPITNPTGKAAG